MKIAVIGSGLAGLTCAAALCIRGHEVILYEQYGNIGGITASMQADSYIWDLGPMIVPDLSENEPGGIVLKKLGIFNNLKIKKLYRTFSFPDYSVARKDNCSGSDWLQNELKTIFPQESKGIDAYYKYHEKVMDISALQSKKGLFNMIKLITKYLSLGKKKKWSAKDLADEYFNDDKLKAFFVSILADYVCSPSDFPGIAIPVINSTAEFDERTPLDYDHHEHRSSWSVIQNGTVTLVNAIAEVIKRNGGVIKTNTVVKKILLDQATATGVIDQNGKPELFDAIVASGGLKNLFKNMIGYEHLPKKFIEKHLENPSLTESVFMLNLGVDYDITQYQAGPICYYYNTYDVDKSIKECKAGHYHKGDDGFLVYIFTAHSTSMAPKGCHSVQIYTIAPNNPINGDWEKDKQGWADYLLSLAEKHLPGLKNHIRVMNILTPKDFQKMTHLEYHSFGGCTPNINVSPPPHKTPLKNLWFIGAQSSSFGGVTGAILSGDYAAQQIEKESTQNGK